MKIFSPTPAPPLDQPLSVQIVDGEVVIIGGRLGFSMTKEAALETALQLIVKVKG